MDRCALFVDAGYLLADGAMAVHGTRHREAVAWDYPGLMQLLTRLSRERTGLPLLRCYWYEATVEGRRTPEQDTLADIPGLKLRLARIRPGRREGVDAQVHRDLMTLARNNAVCDAIVVSGDEDLAQVVSDAQDLGIRVTVIHIAADGGWAVSRTLRQECDDIIEIAAGHLRPYVNLVTGAEPMAGLTGGQHAVSSGHARSNGVAPLANGAGHGQPGQQISQPNGAGHGQPGQQISQPNGAGHGQPTGQIAAVHTRPAQQALPAAQQALPAYPGYTPEAQQTPSLPGQPAADPASGSPPASPAAPALPPAPGRNSTPLPAPPPAQGQAPGQPPVQAPVSQAPAGPSQAPHHYAANTGSYPVAQLGPYTGPQPAPVVTQSSTTTTLADAVKSAHKEGHDFGESVARDAPALWLEAVLARKPRMPSDLEARLLQGSTLPIDFLLHDEVRHALRRGFWDALERARR